MVGLLAPLLPAIVASILPVFLIGALVGPMGSEFGYRETTAGWLMASFFAVSALVSRRAGSIADSVGPVRTLQVGLSGSAVTGATMATIADSVPVLAVAMMVGGGCNALTQIAANVYLARYLPPARHGVAFSIKQSANPGGVLVAGLLLPTLVLTTGWRSAFGVASGAALAAALGLEAVRRWHPGLRVANRRPADAMPAPAPAAKPAPASAAIPAPGPAASLPTPASPRKDRTLGLVAAAAGFGSASAVALGGFYVESARDGGVGLAAAGLAASLGSATSIVGRIVAGVRADRTGASPERILGWVAAMLAVGAVALIGFGLRTPWAQWLALPGAYGIGWAWPGVFNLAVVRARPDEPGRATGVSQTGIYVGTTLGPLIFGPVSESLGYPLTWSTAALLALISAAGMLAARRDLERSAPATPPRVTQA